MKKITYNLMAMAVAVSALGSCSDKWDDHYAPEAAGSSDATVYEMIKNDPELALFGKMIDIAGYSDLLNTSQTFTVWAPSDASLASVDLSDTDEVKRIVANHIARFNVSTANPAGQGVRMYNGKMLYFEGNTFGGVAMERSDVLARNGVLHVLTERIPYSYNIREYIDTHAETTSISEFLSRFDELRFDEASSIPLDIDENGNTVYDSVKVQYNRLLDHPVYGLGNILSEDSVFTMLVPDNNAWRTAYERIRPLYEVFDENEAVADSVSDVQTSLAVMRDFIYRARITSPSGKMRATSGTEISDMASFFAGAEKINASNGMIWLTSDVNYPMEETFNPIIRVEAEDPAGRVRVGNTTIYTRVISTDNQFASEISEGSYIEVLGASASTQPAVTFDIPNTLSGEYDIYAVFVPASVDDETVTGEQTCLSFILTCNNENGKKTEKAFSSADFVTEPTAMTTIKVAEGYKFPVSNYYDNLWLMEDGHDASLINTTTKLNVKTNVSNSEYNSGKYVRRFRIDCIYLVPTQK
ncbi:MAG: fasciclin domain-containing protein [Bacteroidales bacterium]|nr:fasciclin domain-containing protein [Bacteroidales bacterium]